MSLFHQPSNLFTSGITVTNGIITDALTVNGVSITTNGGTGSVLSSGQVSSLTGVNAAAFDSSPSDLPSCAVTYNLAQKIDTLNTDIVNINNELFVGTVHQVGAAMTEAITAHTAATAAQTTANTAVTNAATAQTTANTAVTNAAAAAGSASTAATAAVAATTAAAAATTAAGLATTAANAALPLVGGTLTGVLTLASVTNPIIGSGAGLDLSKNFVLGNLAPAGTNMYIGHPSNSTTNIYGNPLNLNAGTATGNILIGSTVSTSCLTRSATIELRAADGGSTLISPIGSVSANASSTTSIGVGTGTGTATVNIANGANTGTNVINIGNTNATVNIKGVPYATYNETNGLNFGTNSTANVNIGNFGNISSNSGVTNIASNNQGITLTANNGPIKLSSGTGNINIGDPLGTNCIVNVGTVTGITTGSLINIGTGTTGSATKPTITIGSLNQGSSVNINGTLTINNVAYASASTCLPKAGGTMTGQIILPAGITGGAITGDGSGLDLSQIVNFGASANSPVTIGNLQAILLGGDGTGVNSFNTIYINNQTAVNSSTISLTNIGVIGYGASSTVNIGTGSGTTATATVNIANGTNSGVNLVNIGKTLSSTVNLLGVVNILGSATIGNSTGTATLNGTVNISPTGTGTVNIGNSTGGVNISGPLTVNSVAYVPPASASSVGTSATSAVTIGNQLQTTTIVGSTITMDSIAGTGGSLSLGSVGDSVTIAGVTNFITIGGALSDETTVINASNTLSIRLPYAFRITSTKLPVFWVNTAVGGAVLTLDITLNGTSIYSTKPTIAIGATTSSGGVLAASPTTISEGIVLRAYVSSFASGTGANGLKVVCYNT